MWDRVNGNLWDELTDNICGSEPVVWVPSLAPIDSLERPGQQAPHWEALHQQRGVGGHPCGAVD